MTGKNLYLVLYVAVSLLCVSISVYLSYWGYLSHLRELTLVFAVLIGLLLFGADMLIRQTLVEQRSLFLQLLFFGVILIFSGASNFNFLYTNFMASTIAERAVRDQFETFRSDLTATQRRLIGQEVVQEHLGRRQLIEAELENLRQQLGDPLRPGCGERCEAHLEAINGLLGGAPTDLARPPVDAGAAVQMAWYGNYRTVVLQDFEARWGSGRVATSLRVSARIDQLLARHSDPDAVLREQLRETGNRLLLGEGLPVSATLRRESIDIERIANSVLPAGSQVQHTRIESDLDKIGEIPIALRDAFIERPNLGVTVISLLLAVFVDTIPVLFAVALARARVLTPSTAVPKHLKRNAHIVT
jgi:hypothetical protein